MLTLQHIAQLQESEQGVISVNYSWKSLSNIPVAKLQRVWIAFLKPHPLLWKYIMTQTTDDFEIRVTGTRNKPHDGLDDQYVKFLEEVNAERAKIGLSEIYK